jgi:predicted transcriptional regulator
MSERKVKPNRSDKYQHLIVETVCPNEMLESFPNGESIYKRLNPFDYNDRVAELEDELKVEFWRIVEANLTKRQKEVVKLYSEGLTQMEIAKLLGVNQSSITKSINGNIDYSRRIDNKSVNKNKVSYGGIKRKLRRVVESDEKIKRILLEMSDLRDENWG